MADQSERSILSGGVPGEPTVFAYASPTSVVLQPNTYYYLAALVSDPNTLADNFWFESAFNHEYRQSNFFGFSFDFFDEDKWNAGTLYSGFPGTDRGLAMRVEVTAIPEPTTLSMMAVGGVVVGVIRRVHRPLASA